ncbi:MAG: hypothetical protein OEW52_13015, partial [Thermoleophilia bacterium]|nr:hypothetical protein [Thermoleophilia bacterium]
MIQERRRRQRSSRYVLLFGALLALLAFAATASGNLNNSGFDAGDGNLVVNDETKDWANVGINCTSSPKVGCALDKPTGTNDDSFTQGADENEPNPAVDTGSIPNNKSDLTRFYIYSDSNNDPGQGNRSEDFVYLAWERVQEPTGTTNMDFEFNQNKCVTGDLSSVCSRNEVTPARTQGDVLIKYDLSQGGTNPTLGYHLWQTEAANPGATTSTARAAICEAGNKFPCWGKLLSLTGNFEGSINTGAISDPINPDAPRSLSARTFGEAAINLTDAGLFPAPGDPGFRCVNFGSAFLKSRSSDSFTAALKDFIAPIPVDITNCGKIELIKDFDDNSPSNARVNLFIKNNGATIGSKSDAADGQGTGEVSAFAASYNISETAGSNTNLSNYSTTVACIDEANSNVAVNVTSPVLTGGTRSGTVVVTVDSDIKCTFTNTLITGKIELVKDFDVNSPANARASLFIKNSDNTVTVGSKSDAADSETTGEKTVVPGSYNISETAGSNTSLSDYVTTVACVNEASSNAVVTVSSQVVTGDTRSGTVSVAAGADVKCTFTNVRRTFTIVAYV